jgi:hypothetical protein
MLTALPVIAFTPYWIYTNPSTTQVGSYEFTLITPAKADMGENITLQAHLEYHWQNGSSFPVNNAQITFYTETGGLQQIGNMTTNQSGDATLWYIITSTTTFEAGYFVLTP